MPLDLHNFVPLPYRKVSFQKVEVSLEERSIRQFLSQKKIFEATEFIVFESLGKFALVSVQSHGAGIFREIVQIEYLAGPKDCHFVHRPTADVGNPSELAAIAHELQIGTSCALIVEGRFGHLNFILKPDPIVIQVIDLVPPESRLLDLVRKALEFGEFPPCRVQEDLIQLRERADMSKKQDILVPCRVSGFSLAQKRVHFLDEHPPKADWTLAGCPRSQEIYSHFYGEEPQDRIETCPKRVRTQYSLPTLLRCCWQQTGTFETGPNFAVIPWGADVHLTIKALKFLVTV